MSLAQRIARNSSITRSDIRAYKKNRTRPPQLQLGLEKDLGIIVDNFAGGGGASHGIERALGAKIDIAINHNSAALATHKANHPYAQHYCEDVWKVDPRIVTNGRPVRLAWFSPDCRHFSKARGGTPVKKEIRGLAWVAIRWASTVRPLTIFLENIEEFQDWGPIIPKKNTDGSPMIDTNGDPLMTPDPSRRGWTFNRFIERLRNLGYKVDWREIKACDYGAPTIRKRLFIIARCDGQNIIWPKVTHGKGDGLIPYRTAAECIDWKIPTPSIFERKKSLVEKTHIRIANGIRKFVIENDEPFIINTNGTQASFIIKHFSGATGTSAINPFPTIMSSGTQNQILSCSLIRHFSQSIGQMPNEPMPTIVANGQGKTGIIASHLIKFRGTCRHGQSMNEPMATITSGGLHLGEVRTFLERFVSQKSNTKTKQFLNEHGLNIVNIKGELYQIADIGMRMLTPRELFKAQGFDNDYIIDPEFNGKPLTKTAQYRLVGNSVSPNAAEAIVRANCK